MPYPGPREAMPSPWYCSDDGVEIANPLFRAMNNVGEGIVDAKYRKSGNAYNRAKLNYIPSSMPAWKSPSEAAPSPKNTAAQFFPLRNGSRLNAKATPAACGICVANGDDIVWKCKAFEPKCYQHTWTLIDHQSLRAHYQGEHMITYDRHLSTFGPGIFEIAKTLGHYLVVWEPSPQQDGRFAILSYYQAI